MSTEQSHQVHFHHQANGRPIKPRQSSSCVKQSKNLEETLVQLLEGQIWQGQTWILWPLAGSVPAGKGANCLAEGRIAAVIDPHDNLMNWFLNEWEPTAPPVDGMNVDLLKQLLNAWEPLALPVTHETLNWMDGSSTPAQDVTMQVDFLEDLQNVWEPSPLPITHESSNLRDQSPQPDSPTNLLAQLQDMREPMPPPLVSNMRTMVYLTFGMPEQSEMRDLFEEICNISCYHGNTTPSDLLFNPTLDRHLAQAANAIARELGTAARDQYVCGRDGYPLLGMPDRGGLCTSEVDCQYHRMACTLNQPNSLILVMVLHASYTPPLPACYHAYLRHQDDELIPILALHSLGGYIVPWNMQWIPKDCKARDCFLQPEILLRAYGHCLRCQSQTVLMAILRSRWWALCGLLGMLLQ
ncbi:hypothetical protein F5J12DRAFT_786551 [Pisolithus orientalis]|uniref:uncharacterized protein n=1 Tax=Pisolithus orientalis TaxID=936130 RepID=UPI002224AFCB|nr:uncharacterized protein F5J12DRAFT_786551 [Pisolithus orientalis]KAI5990023.1 hypothetical protein F5J12DRAFT_786551 [Pisolithus orientalis]